MLRVVRAPPNFGPPGPPKREKPKDDPRVIALLDRFTIGKARDYMLRHDDATLLTWGLRGQVFSDADLQAVEVWLRGNNPLDPQPWDVYESMHRLDAFVAEQLAKVSDPKWLQDPLNVFTAQINSAVRVQLADCNPRLLKAVFVAFLTIRAP